MKYFAIVIFLLITGNISSNAQGCVAIRSAGGMCMANHSGEEHNASKWSLNVNNRFFKSYKHFRGLHEEKARVENNTEVINHTNTTDFTLNMSLNKRWSLFLDLPIISNARSSLYEHDRKNRHSTRSFGIGDVRFGAYAWLLNPEKMKNGNIQLGFGIKLPTGDYRFLRLYLYWQGSMQGHYLYGQ